MNKQRTARSLGAAALVMLGPTLYATSSHATITDLCHEDLVWSTSPSRKLACAGGQMTSGTNVSSGTGHKQWTLNLDKMPSCPGNQNPLARLFGTSSHGTVVAGCGGDDYTADGSSVVNTGDGSCDAAPAYYTALSCDSFCSNPGCTFDGDLCACGI